VSVAVRWVCRPGLFAIVCALGGAAAAAGEAPPWLDHFAGEPAGSLMRGLELVPSAPPSGLAVSQTHRWMPDLRLLRIQTTLANEGDAAAFAADIPVATWSVRSADGRDAARYRRLAYRDDVWYGSTYWTGPDWTRVGRVWHHPGIHTPSVRRFTAPRDGRVTVKGRACKLHADAKTDGVRVGIRHRDRTIWQAEMDGADTRGVEPDLTLTVRAGDAIRFVVHKRGRIFCDTTFWDPVVTYADGQAFQASKGFSTKEQGEGGWFYEMEVDAGDKAGLPRVHGFGRDLDLEQRIAGVGQPVRLSDGDALPLIVIADAEDQSGIALALGGDGPWRFHLVLTADGRLQVRLAVADARSPVRLGPGERVRAPALFVGAYRGPWVGGLAALGRLLNTDTRDPRLGALRGQFAAAGSTEPDFVAMVQDEWRREDGLNDTAEAYAAATARHLQRARRLLDDLRRDRRDGFLDEEARELERLAAARERSPQGRKPLYLQVRRLKRRIGLANPLLAFDKLLFTKRVPTSYSHLVMQYYGWRARPGGGLFVLERPGRSLACRDILEGKLRGGNVLEPRLSYDARRIVFSYVECGKAGYRPDRLVVNEKGPDAGYYHVWEVNVDGTGLRQLTRGPYDDVMPTYLPDGRIVFCSTRRRGYARCFGGQFSPRWDVYTLHATDRDGTNVRPLSFHDTNEWFPAVGNDGRILYARWDYIDRDAVTHQNLWATRPDGTNPVAVWGNATAKPHCTFQAKPVPGSSKIVFAASAHHSITGGSIALLDPRVGNNGLSAITRITPEVPFPEAEARSIREYYASPWPLSETYFLVAYSPTPLVFEPGANRPNALGIYLLDAMGNRELVYRDPAIGSTNPCPLVPRPTPPMLPGNLPDDTPPTGEMVLTDIYDGLAGAARGSITALRIVQVFPKTTPLANHPPIGVAGEENGRAILGTVPVEPDGSARFLVPARKPLLFQALDRDGFAYQTMRSVTYLQPGERVSCVGCHENRMTAPVAGEVMALRRPPSQIDPGPLGGRPFAYAEVVQPVLDRHCVRCHGGKKPKAGLDLTGKPQGRFTASYASLCADAKRVPRFKMRNQIQVTQPGGRYGALGSGLMKHLRAGHSDVKLSPDDLRRLAAWIDLNAIFYGLYLPEDQARQRRGEVVPMPDVQ